jgi:hypothetical protein
LATALIPFHQEMCIYNLNIEFEELESAEYTDSVRAATATSHNYWLDIQSVDVSVQKSLSNLFSSGRAQKETLERVKIGRANEAFREYYKQGKPRQSDYYTDLIQICQI